MPLVARAVLNKCIDISRSVPGGGGGGGGTQVQRGAAPALRISQKKDTKYWGGGGGGGVGEKFPLQSTEYTSEPSDSRRLPSLLPALAAAKQAEDYKSKVEIRITVHPMSVF